MECKLLENWKSIPFVPSIIIESGIAGRAEIAGTVVISLDGLWTFIRE